MARWDIAEWVGPTPNQSGPMQEYRGLVIHIMQGSYAGSVAWGKNPASSVSFHFATRGDGHIGQLVDTAVTAWTQANGNGHWISVENEGYSGNPLTPQQVEAVAQVYARGVRDYGWPYQLADSPTGRGLGWHGMGGMAWGGHPDCPGAPIVAQRQQILNRARQINEGTTTVEDDVQTYQIARDNHTGQLYLCDGMTSRPIADTDVAHIKTLAGEGLFGLVNGGATRDSWYPGAFGPVPATGGGSSTAGPVDLSDKSLTAVQTIVDQELDEQSLGGADKD